MVKTKVSSKIFYKGVDWCAKCENSGCCMNALHCFNETMMLRPTVFKEKSHELNTSRNVKVK